VLIKESWVRWPDAVYTRLAIFLISRPRRRGRWTGDAEFWIGLKESWEGALKKSELVAALPTPSRPAPPIIPWEDWASPTGRTNWSSRNGPLDVRFRHHHRPAQLNRRHPGGHDRWASRRSLTREIDPDRIIGIDASAKPDQTREQIERIARRTAKLIGLERALRDDEIVLDDRYHANTYGIPDETTLDAMRLAARTEGMVTDPVYEENRWLA